MQVWFRLRTHSNNRKVTARPSRAIAGRTDVRAATNAWLWACGEIGRRRRFWDEMSGPIRAGSSLRLVQARTRVRLITRRHPKREAALGRQRPTQVELEPRQRRTLEVGSYVVLSGLGVGLQAGGWPLWSAVGAAAVYASWVVLYAEVTVQVKAHPDVLPRLNLRGLQRLRTASNVEPGSSPAPQPGEEQSRA